MQNHSSTASAKKEDPKAIMEQIKQLHEMKENGILTEEEFAESKAFVDKVDFYETHIFKYSRREGTKAAAMKDQVPDQIKAARSAELLELNRKKQAVYEERLLGTTQEVLIEEKIVRDGEELQIGHTKEYVKIGVKNPNNLINQLVNVEIENQLQILH